MAEVNEEEVAAVVSLLNKVLSVKGISIMGMLLFVAGGGGGFIANVADSKFGPPMNVQVSSPMLQEMISEEVAPLVAVMEEHSELEYHISGEDNVEAIDEVKDELQYQAIQLNDIEQAQRVQSANLTETTRVLNRLVGQVEILVEMEMRR